MQYQAREGDMEYKKEDKSQKEQVLWGGNPEMVKELHSFVLSAVLPLCEPSLPPSGSVLGTVCTPCSSSGNFPNTRT